MEELKQFDLEEISDLGIEYRKWYIRRRNAVNALMVALKVLIVALPIAIIGGVFAYWMDDKRPLEGGMLIVGVSVTLAGFIAACAAIFATIVIFANELPAIIRAGRKMPPYPDGYSEKMAVKALVLKADMQVYNDQVESLKGLSERKDQIEFDLASLKAYQEAQDTSIDELTLHD